MSERSDLLASIADTIKDYRAGEIAQPTPDHVGRWIAQFDKEVRVPLLRELDHVLQKIYFSKSDVSTFFASQIDHKGLAGKQARKFWRSAHLLDIQEHGHSQSDIRGLFGDALEDKYDLDINICGSSGGAFIYLDDVLFSGGRVCGDLSTWIRQDSPIKSTVHILVIATHRLGEWQCTKRLKEVADESQKDVDINCWAIARFENRKAYRNRSEVLWPIKLPDDAAVQAYVAEEQKFPFEPRKPGGKLEHPIFSSESGRQLLEREFLLAGIQIRSFSENPNRALRPLGFSAFGLGFGSMISTFRNCPNNCPLPLWWGDPNAAPSHPFSKWYPLLPRKTYSAEVDFDDFDI